MATSVTITSSLLSPSVKTVLCNNVTSAYKRDLIVKPYANGGTLAEVQTQSQSNPRYVVQGAHLLSGTISSSLMSYADWITLSKINYDGTNAPVLKVTYGLSGSTSVLANYAGATTGISVIVESFNANISVVDSIDGYRPTLTVNFVETG